VTFDRESCVLFKAELDKLLPAEATEVVISVQASDKKEHPEYAVHDRSRDEEERLLDRFRDPADPLKLIIVTAKLLTGFEARAHPAGDVLGQAVARSHAAPGNLPGEPHLLGAEDPWPDRGLPRDLR
jgi:hypothetical protein